MRELIEIIKKSSSVAVTAHINEDCDALGSVFAMTELLRNMGKHAVSFLSDEPEYRLRFMSSDYKVYHAGDEIETFDLLICLDSADLKRLGERAELLEKIPQSISIDHHYTNTYYSKHNLVDGDASSTGEMVYNLICEMGESITRTMAENLYISLVGDTGCFKYSCAAPDTLRAAAALMEKGIDHAAICRRLFDCEPLNVVKLRGHIMNSIKSYYGGKLSVAVLDKECFSSFGVAEKDFSDAVNIPRMVEGTEVAVSLREVPGKIKLSFRSNGKYNVSELAKHFGGGGHEMAAGASAEELTLSEAEEKIVKIFGEMINDRV